MSDEGRRIVGIGEVLWDLMPDGPRLGGAPFNVTANLARLGHDVRFVSAIGKDTLGERVLAAAARLGVETVWIARTDHSPTGTVQVSLDQLGSPRFRIVSPAAYETIDLSTEAVELIAAWRPDAIVFGTLAQRFARVRSSTRDLIERSGVPVRLYDMNLRDGGWDEALVLELLTLATIVKANVDEAAILAGLLGVGPGGTDRSQAASLAAALADRYGIHGLCVTRGADGAVLWLDGARFHVEGIPIDVADAVGAGDAFSAALLDGMLRGRDARGTLARANRLGAIVTSRAGALPEWAPDELEAAGSPRR